MKKDRVRKAVLPERKRVNLVYQGEPHQWTVVFVLTLGALLTLPLSLHEVDQNSSNHT